MSDPYIKYIANEEHYNEVLSYVTSVRHNLDIGTADIKDLYVKRGNTIIPFIEILSLLIDKGVDIRLIHAKSPGAYFKNDLQNYPQLWNRIHHVECPRVHFKLLIFDDDTAYIGSANLTGAGIGMKNIRRRNFEAGILTNASALVSAAQKHFDDVFFGAYCSDCGRKQYCSKAPP